jgi:tripartite-type tricarboxylate transporter receptor subunit TctC
MVFRKKYVLIVLLILVLLVGSKSMAQSTPDDFYKGKTITIVNGYNPGSDFDRQARLIAPFLKEATGAQAVVVEAMPGGGGNIARNWFFNDAKNDGLTIMVDHGPRIIQNSLFQVEGVNFNWSDFIWIGKLVEENIVFAIDKNLDIETVEDLANARILVGVSRPFYEPQLLEALGLEAHKLVPGYDSPSEKIVSIARGEVNSCVGNTFTFMDSFDIIKPFAITFPHKNYPGVPTFRELASPDKVKWVDYLEGFQTAQYSFIAPPGTPTDRVKFLEESLKRVYDNPEAKEELATQFWDETSEFIGSEKLTQITKNIADISPEEIKELEYVLVEKYLILK